MIHNMKVLQTFTGEVLYGCLGLKKNKFLTLQS